MPIPGCWAWGVRGEEMLYLPAQNLSEAVGVSTSIVNRWIQCGVLRGINSHGVAGFGISTSAQDVLVEFDSLFGVFQERFPELDIERLRDATVEIRYCCKPGRDT
jgi:hypothetical protein